MMRIFKLTALAVFTQFAALSAFAGDLQLPPNKHWLTVASTKDKDTAIGIARNVSGLGDLDQVVASDSGYYAVILGPYEASSIEELKKKNSGKFDDVPKDALFSQGAKYTSVVWTFSRVNAGLVGYSMEKPAQLSADGLSVKVSAEKLGTENAYTAVSGTDKSGTTFSFDIGKDAKPDDLETAESYAGLDFHQAGLAKLVPGSGPLQVVITNFSGGAHCCTQTNFLSKPEGAAAWSMIEGDTLDGDGYWYEDVDGDGTLELMSVDNRFLYAFDSYAGSLAPMIISQLRNGKVDDVTMNPEMKFRLAQELAGMEFSAKVNADLWKSNGFLVGWLAEKIRLGQGKEAWTKFEANYDKNSGFGPQICTTGQKIDDCPTDKMQPESILKGVAEFLKENGYYPLPDAAEKLLK